MQSHHRFVLLLLSIVIFLSACSGPVSEPTEPAAPTAGVAPTSALGDASGLFATPEPASSNTTSVPTTSASAEASSLATIVVQRDGPTQPFNRQLLGVNVPAWLSQQRLSNPQVITRTVALGTPLLRLPGGSWSNSYDWEACEIGDEKRCYWPWAARPTDFLKFLRATGREAIWTVSINGTSKEAAALVAFFNGRVDDSTPIGVDVRGRDWLTIGHWASLRSKNGDPEPLKIKLWEVGNEVYGGKKGAGTGCVDWGWEDVWTCDGTEYVKGIGSGANRHEGYLEFRAAMRAVDPQIQVGAVGVDDPKGWSNWGDKVISAAGADLDFYIVHLYAFSNTPTNAESVLGMPQRTWARVMSNLNAAFDRVGGGRRVPVAVTEYNLIAFQDLDKSQLMLRAVNALFIADTIGQMAEHGVSIANQWALANGKAENGTDYGLIDADTNKRNPQYYALLLWSRFGNELLPVSSSLSAETTLSVYAGREADGSITLLAINKTDRPIGANVQIEPASGQFRGEVDTMQAASLEAQDVRFNGVLNPSDPLSSVLAQSIGPLSSPFKQTFPPFSITLIRLSPTT